MAHGKSWWIFLVGGLFLLVFVSAGWGAQPTITYMRTCSEVIKGHGSEPFEAKGWTSTFDIGDTVYCVVRVRIPYYASYYSYPATMTWRTPDGKIYRKHDWSLRRGSEWYLWGWIEGVSQVGEWRVTFSLEHGPRKTITFTVKGIDLSLPEEPSGSMPSVPQPVKGREVEPNETAGTANLVTFDASIQGEARFYTQEIFDQDWFYIELSGDVDYWLEINAVGMTDQWLSPAMFLRLYKGSRLDAPLDYFSYSRQQKDEERSSCDVVVPLRGPGRYYIVVSAQECGFDIAYSLRVSTTRPEWTEK